MRGKEGGRHIEVPLWDAAYKEQHCSMAIKQPLTLILSSNNGCHV